MASRTDARIHGALLLLGVAAGAVLLGRLAYDLSALGWWMAVPIWGFYALFLGLGGTHAVGTLKGRIGEEPATGPLRLALVVAIPLAYFGSVFDCMGLSFRGCTPVCDRLTNVGVLAVTLVALAYLLTGRSWLLTVLSAGAFVFLIPNCVCRNPANAWWMDLLGRSPACFAGANGVALLALGALRTRRLVGVTLVVVWVTIGAMLAFFVGHHYYQWPW